MQALAHVGIQKNDLDCRLLHVTWCLHIALPVWMRWMALKPGLSLR